MRDTRGETFGSSAPTQAGLTMTSSKVGAKSAQERSPAVLEWFPDFDGRLLHLRVGLGGVVVALEDLPLSPQTAESLRVWIGAYASDKLPTQQMGDQGWIDEGIVLLARCRGELRPEYRVVVSEPWWGESPAR